MKRSFAPVLAVIVTSLTIASGTGIDTNFLEHTPNRNLSVSPGAVTIRISKIGVRRFHVTGAAVMAPGT